MAMTSKAVEKKSAQIFLYRQSKQLTPTFKRLLCDLDTFV